MSRKHYREVARIIGVTLHEAYRIGGEEARTAIYDALYRPTVTMLSDDNPQFSELRFAEAVASHEAATAYIAEADGRDK